MCVCVCVCACVCSLQRGKFFQKVFKPLKRTRAEAGPKEVKVCSALHLKHSYWLVASVHKSTVRVLNRM